MKPLAPPPLVDRRPTGEALDAARERARDCPVLSLDAQQVLDVEKIANGTFSPLTGFLGEADFLASRDGMRLADGTPWPIPVTLQLTEEKARGIEAGAILHLRNEKEDRSCALLEVSGVFPVDRDALAAAVYGTTERAHPGVNRMWSQGTVGVGGTITLLDHSESLIPAAYDLDPAAVREEIARRGWRTVCGFQTRNLGHKAHEHLQKIGLELCDGLLVHPLIGWKKAGDMLPEAILDGYELLIEHYYPKERTLLAGLTTAMRYAGPREAVFHAIIRRNFGCTHFIIGRDHAGVGGYYDKYAAHRIFDGFADGELGINPLRLHGPAYCKVCDQIVTEATCPHGPDGHVDISGTEIRAMVGRGECPPKTIMRPEIGRFLIERAKTDGVFFEG